MLAFHAAAFLRRVRHPFHFPLVGIGRADRFHAGELFDNGNADDLAAAIGRLLDDPSKRATLSAAASAAVRDYDWPKIARDVVKVYAAVLPAESAS